MPIPLILAVGAGGVAGFAVGRGTEGVGNVLKWAGVLAVVYVGAKAAKVI
jgi:hypothetical protein